MLGRFRTLLESYLFVLVVALLVGILVPQAQVLIAWNTLLLQAIFFLSSLKMDGNEILARLKDWRTLAISGVFMLVLMPLVVRGATLLLPENLAVFGFAFFLLAAMPSGMTSPLLSELVGGNQPLALVITAGTSLLAPFTVPLMVSLAYGSTVVVDIFGMMRTLVLVIFMPFILAMIVKRFMPKQVEQVAPRTKPISTILLGLLIAGAVAPHADRIIASARENILGFLLIILALFLFFGVLHALGYYAAWWKKRHDRSTVSVCLTYMNFTLAIFLAGTYFPDADVVLVLVLSIIPWATLLPVWKKVSTKLP
ncbi:bile acid:sodium symporter [Patescibacteria group bacterium]|nr:bile acid:sodium symporter [Patescibacteria group bacterium]MBU1448863.1 bile acid:sodium symporter [Patescibacteria group bacterium]MBU2613651.1 bile acid:sodium symporter [Patescibacteria group bacterium]